mgnify:FL=1
MEAVKSVYPYDTVLVRAVKAEFFEADRNQIIEKLRQRIEEGEYQQAVYLINDSLRHPEWLLPYVKSKEIHRLTRTTKRIPDKKMRIQLCMGSLVLNFSKKRLENLKDELIK